MMDAGLAKKIKHIEITTGKIVNEIFAGEYKNRPHRTSFSAHFQICRLTPA